MRLRGYADDTRLDGRVVVKRFRGPEGSKPIYLYNELRDNTHFSEYGAERIGLLVLDRLTELRVLPRGKRLPGEANGS